MDTASFEALGFVHITANQSVRRNGWKSSAVKLALGKIFSNRTVSNKIVIALDRNSGFRIVGLCMCTKSASLRLAILVREIIEFKKV